MPLFSFRAQCDLLSVRKCHWHCASTVPALFQTGTLVIEGCSLRAHTCGQNIAPWTMIFFPRTYLPCQMRHSAIPNMFPRPQAEVLHYPHWVLIPAGQSERLMLRQKRMLKARNGCAQQVDFCLQNRCAQASQLASADTYSVCRRRIALCAPGKKPYESRV